ncbi:Uncharacterised protein [Corynebacterium ulcerans]|nr:Uncharacterised protein [Corynebacterium ulcerans]
MGLRSVNFYSERSKWQRTERIMILDISLRYDLSEISITVAQT